MCLKGQPENFSLHTLEEGKEMIFIATDFLSGKEVSKNLTIHIFKQMWSFVLRILICRAGKVDKSLEILARVWPLVLVRRVDF